MKSPCLRVKTRCFVRVWEDLETLVVHLDETEKEILLEARPDLYFQTDHYKGWPAVLMRLNLATRDALKERIEVAWRRSAPKRVVKDFDGAAAVPRRKR